MNTRAVLHQYMTTVAHGPNKEIEAVLSCYRGNNNFLALTKAIELVCRQHLDVRTDPSDVMLYIQDRGRCPKDGGRYLFVGDHDCFSRYSFTKNGFTQICYKIVEHNSNTFIHSFAISWRDKLSIVLIVTEKQRGKLFNNMELKSSQHSYNNYISCYTLFSSFLQRYIMQACKQN